MAIITKWDDTNKTRVLIEFETSWTWEQLDSALEATDNLLAGVPHIVDIIIDLEGSEIPKDYLKAAQKLLRLVAVFFPYVISLILSKPTKSR